ncbi:nuclear receptor subfamily 1 group D member 1 [Neolamprologus brichardi]|uniref:nuclear receptor subfamily 1 group D member 1 n=1 Tax=Neolamprologus brichardi TaxID=32507 RepID=UPI0003EC118F|nr:nuclear receptor subfamily 1 group D member 1 [Neolamprologus brichardi]
MDTNNNNNNNNNNNPGGVISYVGSSAGSPTRTSPVSMYSENSNSQSFFTSSSSLTLPFLSSGSSSGSAGDDGSSSASSSGGGSPRGRDDGGSLRTSPSKSVASLTKLNGMVLLCKVCGDVASGFHYGVHACEGCKREAELWQPNRCPNGYHANGLNTIYHHNNNLATERYLPENSRTHLHRSNGRQSQQSGPAGHVTQEQRCPVKKQTGIVLACPMNMQPHADPSKTPQQIWEDFSLSFTPAVREVVEFAKHIPGFSGLSQNDQVTLLKAGTFEVLMVRFASLFNMKEQTVTFVSGATYNLQELRAMGMRDLLGAMFDFSHKLAALELDSEELGLFTAVVLVSADRSGIEDVASVEQLQENLIRALRSLVNKSPVAPESEHLDVDSPRFTKLLLKLPDLRTLNNMHSEKLLSFRIDV